MDIALIEFMESQLKQTTSTFHRYMYNQVSWESRMFGLVGPRGVGKVYHDSSVHQGAQGKAADAVCGSRPLVLLVTHTRRNCR